MRAWVSGRWTVEGLCATVQQPETTSGSAPGTERVDLEVDRETLGEMVGTFVGIRDQLAVMTNK